MNAPTHDEMMKFDGLEEVYEKPVGEWRWGVERELVVLRKTDNTYWRFCYRYQSGDGDYHGLRENDYDVCQVEPEEVSSTVYTPV